MATVSPGNKMKKKKVTFSIEAADAGQVILAGDFNGWNTKKHPMKKDGNGVWKKSVMLPSDVYEYKFLVDGNWREDPANDKTCPNCFGTFNNVLSV